MGGEVEHGFVGEKDVLGAVAVVDVPVEDGDPLDTAGSCVSGGDRRVVEEAEAHRVTRARVVTRRPDDGEGRLPAEGALDGPAGRPARELRDLEGAGPERRVRVEVAAPGIGKLPQPVHVIRGVDAQECLSAGGFAGASFHARARTFGGLDPGHGGRKPRRDLDAREVVDVAFQGRVAVYVQTSRSMTFRLRYDAHYPA
nr:hypothetical protein [Rubrobacter tropicus]